MNIFTKKFYPTNVCEGVNLQRWASVRIVEFMLVEKSLESRPSDILLDQKDSSVKKRPTIIRPSYYDVDNIERINCGPRAGLCVEIDGLKCNWD